MVAVVGGMLVMTEREVSPGYLLQRGQQGLGRESAWDQLREVREHGSLKKVEIESSLPK